MLLDHITDPTLLSQQKDTDFTISWENITVHADSEKKSFVERIWNEVSCDSRLNDQPIKILDTVSGHAEEGNLVAIMGPSGAGKTTLLAALARRVELSSGFIRVNGFTVSKEIMSKISGYLPQFDALPLALKAEEYMLFTCALKLGGNTCREQRDDLTNGILMELGLHECKETLIEKLSGGERKRLSLAAELIGRPKILFLDEPTSGLDTWTAMRVIESAKIAARSGTIVFCSIHQPAMDLYKMFSHIILLADGKTAYCGTPSNARTFFNSEGFQCPPAFDEAEFYVRVVSNESSAISTNTGYSLQVCSAFSKSFYSKMPPIAKTDELFNVSSQINKPSWVVQFFWLIWRIVLETRRTMFNGWIHHQSFLLSVGLIGLFYTGIDYLTQPGIQDARGALYFATSEIIFTAAYSGVYDLPRDVPLYLRENTLYGPGVYYVATFVGMIPGALLKSFIFITVMYFVLDMNTNFFTFMQFCFCAMLATISGKAYGTMISSCIEDCDIATSVMVPIDLAQLIMAGMFYNIRTLPRYLTWLKYVSIFYYTNETLSIVFWAPIDKIECLSNADLPCLTNGLEVLAEYGFDLFNFWSDTCGLIAFTVLMNLVGYYGVKRRRVVKSMY